VSADDPPAIVFLGTKDPLIPVEVVKRFKSGMAEMGVRCDLRLYEGQRHGFFNPSKASNQYYFETLRESDEFLTSLGWLKRLPTLSEVVAK
jgi:dienelactone hydrolase